MRLVLRAVGSHVFEEKEWLGTSLAGVFGTKVVEGAPLVDIGDAFDRGRGQYLAGLIVARLAGLASDKGDRVLGVTSVDLYTPGLNFVFGQADIKLRTAVISLYRLRQEFYGLPADRELFRSRMLKEAVHEIGHTFGLGHCSNLRCVMHFSNCLADTDLKGFRFCSNCQPRLLM
ncbi:MAG: archaemetzincin family Zn-dependent metalloprotease [Dehalococcoidia bacterium]|nr:archaemetzincin family Zn-dependent metalloprotease [Dehalococcoidia bacterium]